MSVNGWLQIALYCRDRDAPGEALRRLQTQVFNGELQFSCRRSAPVGARLLLVLRRRRDQGAALGDLRGRMLFYHRCRLRDALPAAAAAGGAAVQPRGQSAVEQSLASIPR